MRKTIKQDITLEQWKELPFKNKVDILVYKEDITRKEAEERIGYGFHWLMNIGEMIEFLGDDIWAIGINHGQYTRNLGQCFVNSAEGEQIFCKMELVNALWEAVKYKLKQV